MLYPESFLGAEGSFCFLVFLEEPTLSLSERADFLVFSFPEAMESVSAPAPVSETPKETPQAKVEEKAEEKKDKKKEGSGVLTLVIGGALLIASFGAINYFRKQ